MVNFIFPGKPKRRCFSTISELGGQGPEVADRGHADFGSVQGQDRNREKHSMATGYACPDNAL
jgi:hypothetical protein